MTAARSRVDVARESAPGRAILAAHGPYLSPRLGISTDGTFMGPGSTRAWPAPVVLVRLRCSSRRQHVLGYVVVGADTRPPAVLMVRAITPNAQRREYETNDDQAVTGLPVDALTWQNELRPTKRYVRAGGSPAQPAWCPKCGTGHRLDVELVRDTLAAGRLDLPLTAT